MKSRKVDWHDWIRLSATLSADRRRLEISCGGDYGPRASMSLPIDPGITLVALDGLIDAGFLAMEQAAKTAWSLLPKADNDDY